MKRVADHLKLHALSGIDPEGFDLFGRSAFNRYYYATFLVVRAGLRRMGLVEEYGEIKHASIPEMLSGKILKAFKRECLAAKRIGDSEAISTFSLAADAAKDLSELMRLARGARTAADYQPEILIIISGQGFSLLTVSIESAQTWPSRAGVLVNRVEAGWRQLQS